MVTPYNGNFNLKRLKTISRLQMRPGTIFFDNLYQLEEVKQFRELLVILTDGAKYPYITIKTTSQPSKDRGNQAGCQIYDDLPSFFLPLHSTYLKEDTWIRLDHFENVDPLILETRIDKGEVDQVCKLPPKIMNHLLLCAISSKKATEEQKQELWNTLEHIEGFA